MESPSPLYRAAHRVATSRIQEIRSAEVRLLFANASIGTGITILAAALLGGFQWTVVARAVIGRWWAYMALVGLFRWVVARAYRKAPAQSLENNRWGVAFAAGTALAGAGWGAAGIFLYPPTNLTQQIFLFFVLGGMMLGAATLLAPRPEAFLPFLVLSGLPSAARLLIHTDPMHGAMGLLAIAFTIACIITTWRIHRTLEATLWLQFENADLVEHLKAANDRTEALNQVLETRVRERTAELQESAEQLRAEIVQRKKTEDELLRARKLESLGVLAGGIAHDFNNFLTVVQGNIELAKMRLHSDDALQEILNQTIKACQRAVFLSSQLLTFAKGGSPVRHITSVATLVKEAVQLARAGAAISISMEIAGDLLPANVDANQISQVLHNMLLNAREAMPEGGIIEVRAENVQRDQEPFVRISIQDYGCGIHSDVLSRIFDPYFTTKPRGSGLGLATAHAIVNKHGGHISVESHYGVGTLFTMDLPASSEAPAPERSPAPSDHEGTGRILVMDDEEALRTLLATILTNAGYEIRTARDGAEAVALYEDAEAVGKGFDLVLLDLTVSGGMGGVEAAAKLKEKYPSAKLIVSSGYADAPVMSNFSSYGFDAVIPKPWKTTEVKEILRRMLAGLSTPKAE
jgi:signal transduction histidine kinase/ActR/RegA family two-component response regulator